MRTWPIILTVGFAIMFAMNATLFYLATSHPDPIVDSYKTEAR